MQITFLGTSAMVPTKERNVSGFYVDTGVDGILVDCGEGTQRQMNIAGISRMKVKKILITHWHGDHVSGLIGLIQTVGNSDVSQQIAIYGPEGTEEHFGHLMKSCIFHNKVDIIVKEIKADSPTVIFENRDYKIEAANVKHGVPCIAYSIIEQDKRKMNMALAKKLGLSEGPLIGKLQSGKEVMFKNKKILPDDVSNIEHGRKITFILDTWPCKACTEIAQDADILIMESSYATKMEEKADKHMHMTAQQAAQIAHQANVKRLILTHFSQRYKTVEEIEENARDIFPETVCAFDFMKVKL